MPIELPDLLIFTTAALALNITPGNDMMFVLGQSVRGGPRHGIAASLGIATGSLIHLILVAVGVALLLARHPAVFEAMRWVGAAYLVWLAWKALNAPPIRFKQAGISRPLFLDFRDGMLVNLFNPKVIVFMFAFLPPFVRPDSGSPLLQLFILGFIFNAGGTLVNIAVAVGAGRFAEFLAASARAGRAFNAASAAIFVFIAARIAFDRH